MMEDIERTIEELDANVSKEGAVVRIDHWSFTDTNDVCGVRANRRGYLRLGIEVLKAAFKPTEENVDGENTKVSVDLRYLESRESHIVFGRFERDEDLPACTEPEKEIPGETKKSFWSKTFWPVVTCLAALLFFGSLMFLLALGVMNAYSMWKNW